MEIIHVILGKANPERMNGVNKVVYQLVTRQVKAGYNASVWGITHDLTRNYPERNFSTSLFRASRWPFRLDKAMRKVLRTKKGKAVFHLHGGFNPVLSSVSRQLQAEGIPYVFTPHGAYNCVAMKKSWLRKSVYTFIFEKQMLKRAGYVHCLGRSELQGLHTITKSAKPLLLPYGFEVPAGVPASPVSSGFVIGFCGRLDIYTKGLDVLLDAYLVIKKEIPQASLWIIGDGSERAVLEAMVLSKGAGDVWMAGSRFGEEKDALLRLMHVFAHPSRNEGLPSAVLEAAAMGIPCVISEATNLGEAVKTHKAGIVITQTETALLVDALRKMFVRTRSNGWSRISAAAKNMVISDFNWDTIITSFGKMYRDVWEKM